MVLTMPVKRHVRRIRKEEQPSYPSIYAPPFPSKMEFEQLKVEVEYLKKKVETDKTKELEGELNIPKDVFERLPKEIQKSIKGVQLCYEKDHADFCFMGIRKALSTAIHIRFKRAGKEKQLYDDKKEPYDLAKWIELAKQNGFLSANLAKKLTKELKLFGDTSSHDYMIDFHKEDVPSIFMLLRLALDRMYCEN